MEEPDEGHGKRDPRCQLRVYFETAAPPDPSTYDFALIFRRLIELFGEYPVRLSVGGIDNRHLKLLDQTRLDWKVSPYRQAIDTMSS